MRYVSVRLPKDMVEAVERLISSNPELKYKGIEDFITEALNSHLERVQNFIVKERKEKCKK